METFGLYIHIPFCHSKCSYCDFYSMRMKPDMEAAFITNLLKEWELRRDEVSGEPDTLYIGGGTPSILSAEGLSRLVTGLGINHGSLSEFTVEVNPEDITPQRASSLRELGVKRVSMGVQSLDDTLLKSIGRRHDSATAIRAYKTLRESGITNISLDLMYGLPGQTIEQWRETLDMMVGTLQPQHLSAYILSYEPGTRMTAMRDIGKVTPLDDDTILEMYAIMCEASREAGYTHYEISNFAKPGFEAVHNSAYWNMSPYIGLGPGAHSYDGKSTRRSNPWNLKEYMSSLQMGQTVYEVEKEDDVTLHNDMVMVGLRIRRGLDLNGWPQYRDRWVELTRPFIESGEMLITADRLVVAEESWPMCDTYISQLLIVE